ncbi:hypothetical protein ACHAXR_001367, partial [Thalassiosira sp. AJA248-18]
MDESPRRPALRNCPFFPNVIFLCCFVFISTQCEGAVFPTAAFIRGHGSFLRRTTNPSHHAIYGLTTDSSKPCNRNNHDKWQFLATDPQNRRECLASLTFGASAMMINAGAVSATESGSNLEKDLLSTLPLSSKPSKLGNEHDSPITTITLPLEPASGGTFCVRVTVVEAHDAEKFRVYRSIVDTGSPYLVLPYSRPANIEPFFSQLLKAAFASTQEAEDSLQLSRSDYPATEEVYGAVKGQIDWKLAQYMFRDPRLKIVPNNNGSNSSSANVPTAATGVVGVLDEALTNEATGGGMIEPYALLGLIQNNNPNRRDRFPDPRPSFFEQERIKSSDNDDGNDMTNEQQRIKSFSINGPLRELTLSTHSMIPATAPVMPLVDLRAFGDFVDHYAVIVDSLSFDGVSVSSKRLKEVSGSLIERPIVAVFDTGLTGCLLIRPFWDVIQKFMIASGAPTDEFGSV